MEVDPPFPPILPSPRTNPPQSKIPVCWQNERKRDSSPVSQFDFDFDAVNGQGSSSLDRTLPVSRHPNALPHPTPPRSLSLPVPRIFASGRSCLSRSVGRGIECADRGRERRNDEIKIRGTTYHFDCIWLAFGTDMTGRILADIYKEVGSPLGSGQQQCLSPTSTQSLVSVLTSVPSISHPTGTLQSLPLVHPTTRL